MSPEVRSPSERDRSTLLDTITMLARDLEEMTQQRDLQRDRRDRAERQVAEWQKIGCLLRRVAGGDPAYLPKKSKDFASELLEEVPEW